MEKSFDICLLSIFGRGNWLASELTQQGYAVTLIDVTEAMGRWAPEDWEGPFGYLESDKLIASQKARLNEEDYSDSVDQGFTVLLKDGPVDLRSTLSNYLLQKKDLNESVEEYLRNIETLDKDKKEKLIKNIKDEPFDKTWMAYLAHQMASNIYKPNAEALQKNSDPLPVFSSQMVRRVSRKGREKSLEWIQDKGVRVLSQSKIKDIHIENKICVGIEVEGETSGVIKADKFIWMISGEETEFLSSKITEKLYPSGPVKSSWSWLRFRVRLEKEKYSEMLPIKFAIINDIYLPWTHSNLCLAQKTVRSEDLDVWVRIPSHHRFEKQYIESTSKEVIKLLEERLPQSMPTIMDMPQDYLYTYAELGPSRFPVYEEKHLNESKSFQAKNVYYDSPEKWSHMDWTGQFANQTKILNLLKSEGVDS